MIRPEPLILATLLLAGCPENTEDTPKDDTGETATSESLCPEPTDPPCVDAMILDLSLHDDRVSDGAVTTTQDGDDFVTVVDATAGGFGQDANNPWVYVRFAADGASRVDLDDETALESLEWHLALRRFHIRLNSGDGGPSCVLADPQAGSSYADISEVPESVDFQEEDIYDGACELQMDAYGMSPAWTVYGWWESAGQCVQTTGLPFLVRLDDGRVLKMVVEAYYASGQEDCNASGTPGESSGTITLRWRQL